MPDFRLPLFLLATLAAPSAASAIDGERRGPIPPGRRAVTEVMVQSRIIIRIPRVPVGRVPMPASAVAPSVPPPPIRWIEKKADKCVPLQTLAGAAITGSDSVDLILAGGKRMRARFDDDCPALDFYSGLYVRTNSDGKLCAARDSIRSRAGGECRIESLAALVPGR